MLKSTRWTVAAFFICALSAGAVVGRPSVAQVNDQAGSLLKLDEPPILPELLSIPPIGPYQITDIAPTGEGFLMATGAGGGMWTDCRGHGKGDGSRLLCHESLTVGNTTLVPFFCPNEKLNVKT